MEGWKRLYIVILVGTSLITLLSVVLTYPRDGESFYVVGCEGEYTLTIDQANSKLRSGSFVESSRTGNQFCRASLADIANGKDLAEARERWRKDTVFYLSTAAILLAGLFVSGRAAGWVWRGFFPKKNLPK